MLGLPPSGINVGFPPSGVNAGFAVKRGKRWIRAKRDKCWVPAKRDKRWLLRYFPHKGGFLVCGDGYALTEAGQPVGGEVNGWNFVVVQRADEFCGERRLGQAKMLVAEGE